MATVVPRAVSVSVAVPITPGTGPHLRALDDHGVEVALELSDDDGEPGDEVAHLGVARGGVSTMIRVAVVDNDPIVRDALSQQVNEQPSDFIVVAAVGTVQDLVAADVLDRVDVVLLDVLGTGTPFGHSVQTIQEFGPGIIAITTDPGLPEVRRVVRQTTISAVDKNDLSTQLHQAIRLCAAGIRVVSPRFEDGSARVHDPALTERQQQVLALVASGIQAKVAARRLGIAYRTLCDHVTEIVNRLNDRPSHRWTAGAALQGHRARLHPRPAHRIVRASRASDPSRPRDAAQDRHNCHEVVAMGAC